MGPYWHQWGPYQPPDDPNGPILVNMTKMGPVGQYTTLGHDDRVQAELQISDEPQWPGRQSPHSRARPDPSSPCPACGMSLSVASPGGRKDTFICVYISICVCFFIRICFCICTCLLLSVFVSVFWWINSVSPVDCASWEWNPDFCKRVLDLDWVFCFVSLFLDFF